MPALFSEFHSNFTSKPCRPHKDSFSTTKMRHCQLSKNVVCSSILPSLRLLLPFVVFAQFVECDFLAQPSLLQLACLESWPPWWNPWCAGTLLDSQSADPWKELGWNPSGKESCFWVACLAGMPDMPDTPLKSTNACVDMRCKSTNACVDMRCKSTNACVDMRCNGATKVRVQMSCRRKTSSTCEQWQRPSNGEFNMWAEAEA